MPCKIPKCRIFCLMVSKHFKKQRKHKLTFLAMMIMPVLFSLVIILLRYIPEIPKFQTSSDTAVEYEFWWQALIEKINKRREFMIREEKTFKGNVFIPKIMVGYAPNTTAGIRKLVDGALSVMSLTPMQISSFNDCNELRIRATMEHFIASVCFHNVDESQHGLPMQLHYSILMPSELRLYEDTWIGNNWKVNQMLDIHPASYIPSNTTPVSNYVREGFISLQYYIGIEYLQQASGNAKIPQVLLRTFGLNNTVNELISEGIDTCVLVLLLGFMFPVTILTKEIVEERELSFHYSLNRNSVGSLWQFAAWYFNGFCLQLISCLIFTVVLKVEWSLNSSVFKKCPWHIMLFFFFSYVLSVVAFSVLLAVMIRTTKMVVIIIPTCWIVATLPLLTGQSLESSLSNNILLVVSYLLCNVTMCRGLKRLLSFEYYNISKLSAKQYLMSTLMSKDLTLLMLIGIFYIQTVFYMVLAMVLDCNVCPWSGKLIKCVPCQNLAIKARRWVRRRQRRKRKIREHQEELKESLSRRISDYTDKRERLQETVQLLKEQASKLVPTRIMNQPRRKFDTDISTESMSSTSESDETVRPVNQQNVLDRQLLVWLSNYEMENKGMLESDPKRISQKFYLQQASNVNEPLESSGDTDSEEESDGEKGPIVIEFNNVWKKFNKTFVVRKFSLKVYQNELLVLLGHNAAGKTTILNMACGHTEPSHGSILIDGFDVFKRPARAFEHVGISLQTVNLFNEFTFAEHIAYFCRLRGLSASQTKHDVKSYLHSLHAGDLAHLPVAMLTNGHKRLLQVLCAFAGRTKIVLLDRPMEGVDAEKRRHFYNFVFREKSNRTILITTNYPNVASNLGDRIGILVNGKLFVCGKEMRLLRRNQNVYRLVCYLGAGCNFRLLFNFFAYHIPSMDLESKMGDTAVFAIEHADLQLLYKLVDLLSIKMNDLHLDSFKLKTTSLEQILLKAMMHKHVKNTEFMQNPLPMLANRIRQVEVTRLSSKKSKFLTDIAQLLTHIRVVLRKRFIVDMRCCTVLMLQLLLPSVVCTWCFIMPHLEEGRYQLPTVSMTMNHFQHTVTLMAQRALLEPVRAASKHYLEHATLGQRIIEINPNLEMVEYIRWYTAKNLIMTDLNFVVAAIFSDQTVEALYNNNLMHSAPISLSLVMNSLAVAFVNPKAGINVKLELLPFSTMHTVYMTNELNCLDWVIWLTLSFCFCYVWSMPLLDFGLGHGTAYHRIEVIGGMRFGTLSVANFIYGVLGIIASLIPLNAVILYFHNSLPMDIYDNFAFLYVILIAGACVTSINILLSYWLANLRVGYIVIIIFYSIGIVLYLSSYEWQTIQFHGHVGELNIFPIYAMVNNLMRLNNISEIIDVCADEQTYKTSVHLEQCQMVPNCCEQERRDDPYWEFTWTAYLTMILIWGFIYIRFGLSVAKLKPPRSNDTLKKDIDPDSCFDQSILHFTNENEPDNTWIKEKIRVRTLERPLVKTKALHVENLAVFFRTHVVLNHINFLVERYQIMSVVGVNGSGKTVLIKTILGAYPPSAGSISSFGKYSYQYSEHDNHKLIGYCAQDDTIKEALTVIEYLQIVLIIRGLKKAHALEEAKNLLQIFDLYNSRFHLLPQCSRGVVKRLSLAISLIGYAGLILMDDPFAYLDVSSQRNIYSLIQSQCFNGQAVLYTSSDPKYCDVANRTTLLNRTNLCVIGDREDLQMKQLDEYIVIKTRIKIDEFRMESMDKDEARLSDLSKYRNTDENKDYFQFCSIIEHFFPHAIIKSMTNHMACFWLSKRTYSMSVALETLHKNKNIFFPFTICSPFLKSIFLNVVGQPGRTIQIIEDEDI
ncbi:ATP-binding cassette sub-family A member 17 [Drosophila virilis]|uniref:ATP-binding cassette sub-family A member 17 n=1 Tax=Drosophila virilis TaxID=7244 RepID=UPI00139603F7|nr:ATP-binding cassette sub-family A member 3 [Drosophila virilis]